MVHGVCSSAGCFSMTDEQIAEIYAIARESFGGGQREIQMQSYPFHMTAGEPGQVSGSIPNIAFWKELKNGSDHFEVTKAEPSVVGLRQALCVRRDAEGRGFRDRALPGAHSATRTSRRWSRRRRQKDDAKVAELVASGVKPIRLVYADGGQNPVFAGYKDVSDPDALATGPQEIVLDDPQTRAGRRQDRRGRRRQAPRRERRAGAGRGLRGRAGAPTRAVALAAGPGQRRAASSAG